MKSLFYAGSFAPFTVGHQDVVLRALPFVDKIVIGIGVNVKKTEWNDEEQRAEHIRTIFQGYDEVTVVVYKGLTVDAAKEAGCNGLLRGFRSGIEADAEIDLATVNRELGMETLLVPCRPELRHVSSTLVREYKSFDLECKYEL